MFLFNFDVFETDAAYFNLGDGVVLGPATLSVKDDDATLDPTQGIDTSQAMSVSNEATGITGFEFAYNDEALINNTGQLYPVLAFRLDFSDGTSRYYVLPTGSGFAPTPGDTLNLVNSSNYTAQSYASFTVCFVAGTLIGTPSGPRPVDMLRVGDLVQTADNGPQPVLWIGHRRVSRLELALFPKLRPILIRPGALGNTRPLLVSRQHRMVLRHGGDEVFAPANALRRHLGGAARVARGKRRVDYYHLLCPGHEVLFAEGAPAESLSLGPGSLAALAPQARHALERQFPDKITAALTADRRTRESLLARPLLRGHKASINPSISAR